MGLESWSGAERPRSTSLVGNFTRVEPLEAGRHASQLFAASRAEPGDERLWDYMSYGPFPDESSFTRFVGKASELSDPLFFALIDAASGEAFGMASYLRMKPENGVIEIGNIWFGPVFQGSRQGTEAMFLMAHHAFCDLGYRRLEWKCDARNERSRRAAKRLGFQHEGIFRQHMVVKGRNRDTAWFSILDSGWPILRSRFQGWLAESNFDRDGRQKRELKVETE